MQIYMIKHFYNESLVADNVSKKKPPETGDAPRMGLLSQQLNVLEYEGIH